MQDARDAMVVLMILHHFGVPTRRNLGAVAVALQPLRDHVERLVLVAIPDQVFSVLEDLSAWHVNKWNAPHAS